MFDQPGLSEGELSGLSRPADRDDGLKTSNRAFRKVLAGHWRIAGTRSPPKRQAMGEHIMEKRIVIIGAGVAGLHLGLYLRQHGVDTTIITDRTADQVANSRLPNTAAHFAVTLERERQLGVDHWADPRLHYTCHNHSFGGGPAQLEFRGDFARSSRAVDHRI